MIMETTSKIDGITSYGYMFDTVSCQKDPKGGVVRVGIEMKYVTRTARHVEEQQQQTILGWRATRTSRSY